MNRKDATSTYFERLLRRTGGLYLVIVVAIAQILATLAMVAADYFIQVNAEFSALQLTRSAWFIGGSLLLSSVLILAWTHLAHSKARKRLSTWSQGGELAIGTRNEIIAWQQITSLAWRYSIAVFLTSIFVGAVPLLIYQYFVLTATLDQAIYTLLGAVASTLSGVMLSSLALEHLLAPAREALLPKDFADQLSGTSSIRILIKVQAIILALILTSILFVAPIGYHQTVTALETGAPSVLHTMRTQSTLVAFLALIFGFGLSFLFARSISIPLRQLIETFNKVEAGDLKQRARVTATDETGELAIHFNRMVFRLDELQSSLEDQIALRTEQLKATAEVGRAISSILDPDELIAKVVNLITERFGYYYAAIFLVSPDGRWAELKNATGEAGRELKAKRHRLEISGQNMVGATINTRQPRIAHDVGLEAVRFDNPLLPHTRSEISLPLVAGGHVLGALNAQSTEANAFTEETTETLQGMANQVAIALENARLFQETQQALREIRSAQQRQLTGAWTDVLSSEDKLEYSTGEKVFLNENDSPDALNIPMALRDQIIGEITLEGDDDWTSEDRGWIEAVATQAALALENARLLEESQHAALQERLTAEITAKIWSSATIDGILQSAIQELGNALGATEATIELKIED